MDLQQRAARHAVAVTPSDSADLARVATKGLFVGGAGNITVDLTDGKTAVLFTGVLAGTFFPVQVKRVRATGTTATNIVALA